MVGFYLLVDDLFKLKVIYALNTKNDEHEATITAAKQLHEEMLNKVYAETKQKIEQYR
jgi:Family with sequence similarity 184, A and B